MKESIQKLFNKGVRAENEDDLGFVIKETIDKIIVFGYSNDRYDIPKSEIIAVGMNVIIGKNFPELSKYKVDRDAPLPKWEPIEAIAKFASSFYSYLGFGKSLQEAFDLALVQLELLSIPENAIPKLIVKESIDPSKIILSGKESIPQTSPIISTLLDDLKKIYSLIETNNDNDNDDNNNKKGISGKDNKIMNNLTSYYNQKIEDAIQELSTLGNLKEKASSVRILWVDRFPSNNKSIMDIYKSIGIKFDIAIDNVDAFELLEKKLQSCNFRYGKTV